MKLKGRRSVCSRFKEPKEIWQLVAGCDTESLHYVGYQWGNGKTWMQALSEEYAGDFCGVLAIFL